MPNCLGFASVSEMRGVKMILQVICLADNDGVSVVLEAIRQVVQLHLPFGITYFHIGADEAFQVTFFSSSCILVWIFNFRKAKTKHPKRHCICQTANYHCHTITSCISWLNRFEVLHSFFNISSNYVFFLVWWVFERSSMAGNEQK